MSFLFSIRTLSARAPLPSAVRSTVCAQCRRSFAANAILASGHSKWSKIKHQKAIADHKKHLKRNSFSRQLTMYSKMYGADPNLNPQLASVIAAAKKAGMPKAGIDVAIARGQGKSETGTSLESATLEVMLGPSIAMVISIETDNKQRSLKDLRSVVKKNDGNVTPTAFMFTRRGHTVLGHNNDDDDDAEATAAAAAVAAEEDFDEVMMQALDAGAEDVEKDDEGNVVVWTQPNITHKVAQDLSGALGLRILSSEIIWSPSADKAKVDDPEAVVSLAKLLGAVRDYPDVQAVYINAERGDVSEEAWSAVEEALDS
ncbi:transcriptional regulator TACO1-like protein [Xylaria palmicola]|nr:transcriptional regulator TACO1-like protein [Xylaria palmicola]